MIQWTSNECVHFPHRLIISGADGSQSRLLGIFLYQIINIAVVSVWEISSKRDIIIVFIQYIDEQMAHKLLLFTCKSAMIRSRGLDGHDEYGSLCDEIILRQFCTFVGFHTNEWHLILSKHLAIKMFAPIIFAAEDDTDILSLGGIGRFLGGSQFGFTPRCYKKYFINGIHIKVFEPFHNSSLCPQNHFFIIQSFIKVFHRKH